MPSSLRQASYGLGATQWQTIWHHVLPSALSGILTGPNTPGLTLIQEPGGRPIEDKRAELVATPAEIVLDADEVAAIDRKSVV